MTIGCSGNSIGELRLGPKSREIISPNSRSETEECEPTTKPVHFRCMQSLAPTWCFSASTWRRLPAKACSGLELSGSNMGTVTHVRGCGRAAPNSRIFLGRFYHSLRSRVYLPDRSDARQARGLARL